MDRELLVTQTACLLLGEEILSLVEKLLLYGSLFSFSYCRFVTLLDWYLSFLLLQVEQDLPWVRVLHCFLQLLTRGSADKEYVLYVYFSPVVLVGQWHLYLFSLNLLVMDSVQLAREHDFIVTCLLVTCSFTSLHLSL
jgi:hypothetical protein